MCHIDGTFESEKLHVQKWMWTFLKVLSYIESCCNYFISELSVFCLYANMCLAVQQLVMLLAADSRSYTVVYRRKWVTSLTSPVMC